MTDPGSKEFKKGGGKIKHSKRKSNGPGSILLRFKEDTFKHNQLLPSTR